MIDQLLGPYLPTMLLTLGVGAALLGALAYVFSLQGAAHRRVAYGFWGTGALLVLVSFLAR
jgi:hypothetical protein